MKIIFLLLLFLNFSSASDDCFTVQLATNKATPHGLKELVKQKKSLIDECHIFQVGKYYTLRCGCASTKKEALRNLEKLPKKYSNGVVVHTTKTKQKKRRVLTQKAPKSEVCYTVQLATAKATPKKFFYLQEHYLPQECNILQIKNYYVVRCQCLSSKKEVIVEKEKYKQYYRDATIVTTTPYLQTSRIVHLTKEVNTTKPSKLVMQEEVVLENNATKENNTTLPIVTVEENNVTTLKQDSKELNTTKEDPVVVEPKEQNSSLPESKPIVITPVQEPKKEKEVKPKPVVQKIKPQKKKNLYSVELDVGYKKLQEGSSSVSDFNYALSFISKEYQLFGIAFNPLLYYSYFSSTNRTNHSFLMGINKYIHFQKFNLYGGVAGGFGTLKGTNPLSSTSSSTQTAYSPVIGVSMGVEYKVVSHLFLGLHLKYLQHDYEAVLHKADGTTSTLKCDSSFVTSLGLRYLF